MDNNIALSQGTVDTEALALESMANMMREVIHPRYSKNERNVKAVNKYAFRFSNRE